ncbi:MAG: hypothetical protein JNM72_28285 [Deltaproteobacteria bacterium]|jgi:hypothetical protein|nr:hypothetical protein [Deltaproteobacteria bacterium]
MDDARWAIGAQEDVIGMDRLARSLLRLVARMAPASMIALHGAPGSGKDELLRRIGWLIAQGRQRGPETIAGLLPNVVWFDAWRWSKQGAPGAGLVAAVIQAAEAPASHREQGRKLLELITRLRLDGQAAEGGGVVFSGSPDPVIELGRGFRALIDAVRGNRAGRLVALVDGLDLLTPALRWQVMDACRLLLGEGADITLLFSVGREAALDAMTYPHGELPAASAARAFDDLVDLTITVPNLDVRRITSLLRDAVGPAEGSLRRAFGPEAFNGLSAAAAHRPLGSPRFLRRLALRAVMLAEYATEVRSNRNLTEAQWAWVIISERWPEFRRFMIRGGRQRWVELSAAMQQLAEDGRPSAAGRPGPMAVRSGVTSWLDDDLILASYLRLHAEGFEQDSEGIFWLENLMLSAGL